MKSFQTFCLSVALLTFPTSMAEAQCAQPVVPPLAFERSNWSDLENLSVADTINPSIDHVQDLSTRGHGKLNIDFYGVSIDANGQTAEELFSYLRANLDELIFSGTTYALNSFDGENLGRWNSADPTGALMSFTLAGIDGVFPLEKGSVVVSCYSATSFVFSTVKTDQDGLHPVAGNRAFGVHDHGNGQLTIYVKAADRVVNEGIFAAVGEFGRELIFDQGHQVWLRLLTTTSNKFSDRKPVQFVYSERVNF